MAAHSLTRHNSGHKDADISATKNISVPPVDTRKLLNTFCILIWRVMKC